MKGEMITMHKISKPVEEREIHFNGASLLLENRMKKPLTEKILQRFPRLAAALAAVGAKNGAKPSREDVGRLATMMKASGSIDFIGRDKKNYQFYVRPMI